MLIPSRTISRELARIGVDRAIETAVALGCRVCVSIVDTSGQLISYDRMDGAPFQSAQHAQDKAYSSAGNHTATHEFWDMIKGDPWLVSGVAKIQGLSWLGGGRPVLLEGELIGAVGVSGSCGMPQDQAISEAAIQAMLEAIAGGTPRP